MKLDGKTPRDEVLRTLVKKLVGIRREEQIEIYVNEAFNQIKKRARIVSGLQRGLKLLKSPAAQRAARRTSFSSRAVDYIDGLTPNARRRLIREAWKKANPQWTTPTR